MHFSLDDALSLLERTPGTLAALLRDLPEAWTRATEGEGTWSPFDVVGHLVHGERTDWLPRVQHILSGRAEPFAPFDREAQFTHDHESIADRLATFAALRAENLALMRHLALSPEDLDRPGLHPALGAVTLRQLLSTWVVHDLTHIAQIARVMAKRYADDVGPWAAYLSVLRDRA